MLTMPRISLLVAASLLVAGSAFAQSTATSANTTMGTNPNPPGQTKGGSMSGQHKRGTADASHPGHSSTGGMQSTTTAPGNMMNSGAMSSGDDSGMMSKDTMSGGKMSGGKSMHHRSMMSHAGSKSSVWTDTTRLEALLTDAQTNVNVSPAAWKVVGNEANMLANRIYAHSSGNATARSAARDLRTHVREMHSAAMAGDAAGVRTHASMALPFADKLVDWSMPAGGSKGM